MRLARNMAAAMANSVVVVLINLIAVPFYLRFLGMEAYGLIGFYAILQTMLQVLDLGLAPTVSREVAHNAETGEQRRSASLLRTLGVVYFCVAGAIAIFVALASPWIGAHWLRADRLPEATITQAVALMGLNLACRWPISLYHGALIGAHRLSLSSAVSSTINIAAAVATVCLLAFGPRSILAFFLVQAGFGLLHALVLRTVAHRVIGERDAPHDISGLRRVWRFSAWMGGVAVTSLVFSQLDKVLLSKFVDLESFGHYMLAVLLVSGLQIVTGPALNVIYPKFTTMLARDDHASLARFYSDTSRMFAAVVFSLALGLAFHTSAIVTLWTDSPDIGSNIAPIVGWLATGSALNGIMHFPYALQIASGRPRIPFAINVALLALAVPTIVWLVMREGAVGGAISWAIVGFVNVIVGTVVTGQRIAKFAGIGWISRDMAVPLILSLIPALAGMWLGRAISASAWVDSFLALLAAGVGIVAGALYSPFARQWALTFLGFQRRPCPK